MQLSSCYENDSHSEAVPVPQIGTYREFHYFHALGQLDPKEIFMGQHNRHEATIGSGIEMVLG